MQGHMRIADIESSGMTAKPPGCNRSIYYVWIKTKVVATIFATYFSYQGHNYENS